MDLQLKPRDGLVFNFKTEGLQTSLSRGIGSLDKDIIEKSFTPGAVFNGERRLSSKELTISFELTGDQDDDSVYRDKYNNIVTACNNAEYIEDVDTNTNTRIKIEFMSHVDTPDNEIGTVLKTGRIELTFKCLTPYWEDLTETEVNDSGTEFTIAMSNSGALDTPARFEIATSSICSLIQIYISNPVRGIEVQDLAFGSSATLDDYVIDNNTGEVLLGDDLINRNSRISSGSGFFDFPIGSFTLNLKFSVAITIVIKYRRRYYI